MTDKKDSKKYNAVKPVIGTELSKKEPLSSHFIGKIISINLKKISYFGIEGVWLSGKNYWATIPATLSETDARVLDRSLRDGTIILGKKFIAPIDQDPSTLKEFETLILSANVTTGIPAKLNKVFKTLILEKKKGGWTLFDIVTHCIKAEKQNKHRELVISFLESVLQQYSGPLSMYDPPDEKEGIKSVKIGPDGALTITNVDGTVTYGGRKGGTNNQSVNKKDKVNIRVPEGLGKGTLSAKEALDKEFDI